MGHHNTPSSWVTNVTGRRSKITVPEHCHPLAKAVFAEMRRQGVTYDELEHRAGVLRSTFKAWRTNNRPGLDTIEAALGSLGWHVLAVPRPEALPPQLREDLEAVAAKHCTSLPCLEFIAAAVGRRHHNTDAREREAA
jgi:cytosine/adenosine deaminase-related metal-dependent hydrolase